MSRKRCHNNTIFCQFTRINKASIFSNIGLNQRLETELETEISTLETTNRVGRWIFICGLLWMSIF